MVRELSFWLRTMNLNTLSPSHFLARLRKLPGSEQGLNPPFGFLKSRLSQRITLAVFGSIVAIEAVLLVPSVFRREQELLNQLSEKSAASIMGAVADLEATAASNASPTAAIPPDVLFTRLSQLETLPFIAGATLYHRTGSQAGQAIGSFGNTPLLTYDQLDEQQQGKAFYRRHRRYDSAWVSPVTTDYLVIICHDTTGTRKAVVAFIGRIFFLVVIISGVVTLATMVTLQPILINPILCLKDDLQRAAGEAFNDQAALTRFDSLPHRRDDELGEVIHAFGEMFNHISGAIAQRKQAESKLRESETRFRTLVEQAAESLLLLDREGNIAELNSFALRQLKYRSLDVERLTIFAIDTQLSRQSYEEHWKQLLLGQALTNETIYRCKNGAMFPTEVRSSIVHQDGTQYILCLARDISDRKKAQAAQARLAEVGELAAMIVHEVRNPLATIYMVLSSFARMDLSTSGKLRLALAQEEAERLKRLLNEILTYSKEQQLRSELIDINQLCKDLFPSLQAMPAASDRLIHLIPHQEKLIVAGDRDKLKQVFINLVTNACEAIDVTETVTWRLQSASHQQIKVTVHNGGDPIPPDVLPKLTQPFVSTKDTGNGLGLAITKRIIQAHGGSLTITSSATAGTIVTALLPLNSALRQPSHSSISAKPRSNCPPQPTNLPDNQPKKQLSQRSRGLAAASQPNSDSD